MEKDKGTPFVFYPSFLSQIDKIKNDAMRLMVLDAIARYGCYGEIPDFSTIDPIGLLDAAFEPIMSVIDAAKEKYDTNKEMQKLRIDLRWGNITKEEYEARVRSMKEKEIGNTKDTTEYHGIPRNTTEYHGKIGNTENTINKEKGIRNKEKEINIDRGQTAKRFTPPSLEDIKDYCSEMGYNIDPQEFLDHYQANGWVQGKGKAIRDWKAALRNWNRREPEFAFKPQQSKTDTRRGTGVSATSGKDYEGDFIPPNPEQWNEDDGKF